MWSGTVIAYMPLGGVMASAARVNCTKSKSHRFNRHLIKAEGY